MPRVSGRFANACRYLGRESCSGNNDLMLRFLELRGGADHSFLWFRKKAQKLQDPLQTLAAFLPQFETPGLDIRSSEITNSFVRAAYDTNFLLGQPRWTGWPGTEEASRIRTDIRAVREFDLYQVRRLLTFLLRAGHWGDTAWDDSLESGLFMEIVRRIATLAAERLLDERSSTGTCELCSETNCDTGFLLRGAPQWQFAFLMKIGIAESRAHAIGEDVPDWDDITVRMCSGCAKNKRLEVSQTLPGATLPGYQLS